MCSAKADLFTVLDPRRGQSGNQLAGVVSDHGDRDGHRDGLLVDRQVQDSARPWGVASTI